MTNLRVCRRVARLLARWQLRVVFAESCTGGLVSASLARVPGISEHLCGSAVTYRSDTKQHWLGVPPRLLKQPGPVSAVVARHMAEGVLDRTPEADWSAAITGHLGPAAPAELDGLVYIAIAERTSGGQSRRRRLAAIRVASYRLESSRRDARQREAAARVLVELSDAIEQRVRQNP